MEGSITMKEHGKYEITSFTLHMIAMLAMLIDHIYFTLLNDKLWMNGIGRIAFPIFAFMIVEGYEHTGNIKKYIVRLLIFAIISEIPFNLMVSGSLFSPYQNVLWTFLISIVGIHLVEKIKYKYGSAAVLVFILSGITVLLSFLLAMKVKSDYEGYGVLTVFVFYFFRKRKWTNLLFQIILLIFINTVLLASYSYPIFNIGNMPFPMQGMGVLALIFIWSYNGRRGYYNKAVKYSYYLFYPLHMLILSLIMLLQYY